MGRKCFWALASLVVLVAAPVLHGGANATIYGSVYDAAGKPAAGVSVTLENASLGLFQTVTTTDDGTFRFREIPPTSGYKVAAIVNGQRVATRLGITVNVDDEKLVLPPLYLPAATAAPLESAGQALALETASTAMSGVITGDQLRSLPLYNRNFLALGLLTPNTHDVEAGSELAGASFSVAGNRSNNNNFLLDGVDNVASNNNQSLPFQVNDSIQEFRVTSSTASAEYGRNQGGVVNVVTRRAGNGFHGSVFGYFGNDVLNADNPLSVYSGTTFDKAADRAGSTTSGPVATTPNLGFLGPPVVGGAPQTYNQYVATAEAFGMCTNSMSGTPLPGSVPCQQWLTYSFPGPTAVPNGFGLNARFDPAAILATNDKHKQPFDSKQFGANLGGALIKDKLFAFASYEGTLINNPNPVFERVPSAYDKTYNPNLVTGVPEAGAYFFGPNDPNYVLGQDVLSLFPVPNVVGVPGVLEFFRGEAPNFTHVHNGLARLDYVRSTKSSWTFRYAVQGLTQLHDDTLPRQTTYPGNGAFRGALNQNLSIGFTHSLKPTLINEVRLSVSRFNLRETAQDAGFDATTLGASSCTVNGTPGLACNLPNSAMPTILLNGLDTQSSGASPFGAGVPGVFGPTWSGAFSGWIDAGESLSIMLPSLDYLFPMARLGPPLNTPSRRRDTTWSLGNNVSWTKGKHAVKFGAEFRDLSNRVSDGAWSRGFIYSSNIGEFTSDSETCNVTCAIRNGAGDAFHAPSFDFAQKQAEAYSGRFHSYAFSGYIQDTWRFHPRWTLNYGVRYEYFSPPKEEDDRIWNFDPVANGLVQQGHNTVLDPYGNVCGSFPDAFYPSAPAAHFAPFSLPFSCGPVRSGKIVNSDKNNFAPRAGLAWDVFGNGKTVLRFGVGWYYDQQPISYVSQLMFNRPTSPAFNPLGAFGPTGNGNGNALLGTITDNDPSSFQLPCPGVLLSPPTQGCGLGSSIVNPTVQAAASPACCNYLTGNPFPFSFFSSSAQPFGVSARDVGHSNAPYSRQMSFSWQQQITNKLALEVGYVGTSAKQLPVLYNSNYQGEFGPSPSSFSLFRFFPVMTITNQGESTYHSLLARLRAAEWHGLRLNATYVWSKGIDNASSSVFPTLPMTWQNLSIGYQFYGTNNTANGCFFGGFGGCVTSSNVPVTPSFPTIDLSTGAVTTTGAGQVITSRYSIPQDPFNFLKDDRGRSDFDSKHRLVLDYTWEIPSLEKAWGTPKWLDNWQLSGIFVAQSGQPFTIFVGPIGGEVNQRAIVTGPVSVSHDPNHAIDNTNLVVPLTVAPCTGPFSVNTGPLLPAPGVACTGNSGRNAFTGPNFITFNFAIQKAFQIGGENRMLTFRSEFYNLFNRDNFYNPISQLSTDGFNLNPAFGKIKSAHDPRQIQFAVRYTW